MITKDKKSVKEQKNLFGLNNKQLLVALVIVAFISILFIMTLQKYESSKLEIKIGEAAEIDIRAPREIIDEFTTERLRNEAASRIIPKYRISPTVQMIMKEKITIFLDTARDIKFQNNMTVIRKADLLGESTDLNLDRAHLITPINMDFRDLNTLENILVDIINQIMGRGIRDDELEYEKENLKGVFESLQLSDEAKSLGLALLFNTIQSNEFIDTIETERLMNEEKDKIKPIVIKQNDIIVHSGDIITSEKYELVKESGLLKENNKTSIITLIGMGTILFLSLGFVFLYIYYFNRNILNNNKIILLLLIILLTIIISQGFNILSPYLMPIPAAALLIAILIDPKLAIISNLFIASYLGFVLKLDVEIIFMFVLGGSLGIITFLKQNQRYRVLLSGLYIGVINLIIIASFSFLHGFNLVSVLTNVLYGLLNGVMSGIIALGSLPLWENIFSILTPLKLLELSNPNQPLLRRLLLEAPGSYHHSLLVGNLSEAAAEAINANPLLARVGAYYHDIGKAVKPYFFKENQFGMENPHDKLEPLQSTEIITSHTIDGIKMAKEKRLPKEIIDIIDQHHGDTAVAYFYYKAKEDGLDLSIDKFRYRGSKPQTKEAAIVMLADSTEAAVRSIKGPTKETIEEMVAKIVKGKLNDGQLDECEITYRDITTIINTFVNVLIGIYHDRIEYPMMEHAT